MKNLAEGNIYKNFILFAIPVVLSGLLSQAYNTIDTMIAGKFLGSDGLAALGATGDLITFLSCIFWGYSTGVSIYSARLFGGKRMRELKTMVYNNLVLLMAAALIMAAGITLFCPQILEWFRVDPMIRQNASIYLLIYVWGMWLILLQVALIFMMQAMGASSFQFWMSLLSAVLNVVGNIFTITVLEWGVAGVAVSTVVSALVADIFLWSKMKKIFQQLGVGEHRVIFDKSSFRKSFTYGSWNMVQQMILYASTMMISPMINGLGSTATAGYVVARRVYTLNNCIYQSSAKTLSNYAAQCIGAGKKENLKKGYHVGWLQGFLLTLPMLLVCAFFAEPVCRMFFPKGEGAEALAYAVSFARFFLPFAILDMTDNLFHAFFRGTGAVRLLVVSSLIYSVSQMLYTILFIDKFSMNGVYLAWVLGWATEALFAWTAYQLGWWKK
ncbi:MAG: polysaccharide biosynthesis C-terminal domain-containing protein [Clostridia bacterium]|nr:polysaccharide biosynthesis C-terminal domain-containing protein [Clostridia bacterium]